MKTKQTSLRLVATAFLFAMAAFITSCTKSATDPISGEVSQTVNNESTQDSQQDEVDDMSTGQLNKEDSKGGRVQSTDDGRVACAYITIADTTVSHKISGTLTINFDKNANGDANPNGCTDARGNVRKGMIVIAWSGGRWFNPQSTITITLTNYSINGVVINGTRTLNNITSQAHPLILTWTITSDLTSTWPDAATASRQVHKTRAWDILAGTVTVTQTDGAASAASGTTRKNVSYTVQITTGLLFNLTCIGTSKVYIPVSGVKVITFDNKTVTIDFGSGACDNSFTVTYNGKTDSLAANNGSGD
jgi:hypothetical protein